ncbi:MAG: amidohydrolase, partial [Sphingomonadaceae bacterium]
MRGGLGILVLAVALALPARASTLEAEIRADWAKDLKAIYEDFHRFPELAFQETRTAAIMARQLGAIPGMKVTEGVGRTGVVGVLANGAGPVLLLRADMDGLPVRENSGLAVQSRHTQVDANGVRQPTMHACGHDTHITGLIATARRLAAHRDKWAGTIVFVVQPAEETLAGAKAMVEDGLYTRFPKPSHALAWHVAAGLPTGTISFSDAIQYSSSDGVDVIVPGVGAHGASPHMGRDPVFIGSAIVMALQSVRSREFSPLEPSVITVGTFQAGTARNIIPDEARLGLTLRANSEETRAAQLA